MQAGMRSFLPGIKSFARTPRMSWGIRGKKRRYFRSRWCFKDTFRSIFVDGLDPLLVGFLPLSKKNRACFRARVWREATCFEQMLSMNRVINYWNWLIILFLIPFISRRLETTLTSKLILLNTRACRTWCTKVELASSGMLLRTRLVSRWTSKSVAESSVRDFTSVTSTCNTLDAEKIS